LLLESELGRHNHYKNETLILDTVLKYDQGIRKELALRVRAFGRMSKEVNEVYPIMRYVDSVNCLKVTKILDEHGWLGATEIGSCRQYNFVSGHTTRRIASSGKIFAHDASEQ
jgi:predicted RNA binding protein YcfA (HicA-like mRNA interferase family)